MLGAYSANSSGIVRSAPARYDRIVGDIRARRLRRRTRSTPLAPQRLVDVPAAAVHLVAVLRHERRHGPRLRQDLLRARLEQHPAVRRLQRGAYRRFISYMPSPCSRL